MRLSTSLVAVRKITCSTPRDAFADEDIEQAARLILDTEGVINPIVVRRKNSKSYELVDGVFEYYAAVRARELDPIQGEMIGVFILEPDNEEFLTQQVEIFRKRNQEGDQRQAIAEDSLDLRLVSFESRLEDKIDNFLEKFKAKVEAENKLTEIASKILYKNAPLDVFNNLSAGEVAFRLKFAGIKDSLADQIGESVEKERTRKRFESLNDVVTRVKIQSGKRLIKGISSEKMLDIVDCWSKMSFN